MVAQDLHDTECATSLRQGWPQHDTTRPLRMILSCFPKVQSVFQVGDVARGVGSMAVRGYDKEGLQ